MKETFSGWAVIVRRRDGSEFFSSDFPVWRSVMGRRLFDRRESAREWAKDLIRRGLSSGTRARVVRATVTMASKEGR